MRCPGRQGFTLVEMLLALLVLAVGLTSILTVLPAALNVSRQGRNVRRSDAFANRVRATLHWQLSSGHTNQTWTLPSVAGDSELDRGGMERIWPVDFTTLTLESLDVPRPVYHLSLSTNTNGVVETHLDVRIWGSTTNTVISYEGLMYPERRAW